MMSLVNYDDSDDSENEDNEQKSDGVSESSVTTSNNVREKPSNDTQSVQLAGLKHKPDSTKTVKISIPSLKEFEDDDEPSKKKIKSSFGSGLIGMLPAPRNAIKKESGRLLLPHALNNKTVKPESDKSAIKTTPIAKADILTSLPVKSGAVVHNAEHSEPASNTSEEECDFFNLQSEESTKSISSKSSSSFPLTVSSTSSQNWNANFGSSLSVDYQLLDESNVTATDNVGDVSQYPAYGGENIYEQTPYEAQPSSSSEVDPDSVDNFLNDEGFLRLQGKKHRGREEIKVIDVSADQQITSSREWLAKTLTEEKVQRPSRRKGDMPTQQQRRKHQITYLAFQAKERELELKNQWAQNRLTKRETQAKYGF